MIAAAGKLLKLKLTQVSYPLPSYLRKHRCLPGEYIKIKNPNINLKYQIVNKPILQTKILCLSLLFIPNSPPTFEEF